MLYVFDDYELDTQTCELRRGGVPVALAPKAYAVLAFLVERRDRLISKEELLDELWPDTYVDDSAVKRNIMAIRRALHDRSSPAQCIKTQRSQGYRFIASVTVYDQAPQASAAILPTMSHPREDDGEEPPDAPRYCAACQHPNHAAARFCAHCGTSLETHCPQCAQAIQLPASFCPACGHRLIPAADAAPSPPPAISVEHEPIGERKLVTVLYCALADTSGLVARRGLDAMHNAMHAVYDCAVAEAQRYAGTVQAVTGANVLIFFGLPVTHEDHAQRAVLTAIGLQQRLLQENIGGAVPSAEEMGLRLVLHTGPVVVGPLGHDQSATAAVVGDVTTRAAAIAHHAPPGTIVASGATIRLVPGTVETQVLPALHIHDDLAPLPVYHVLHAVSRYAAQGLNAPQTRSPFVGRDAEMALLRTRFARVEQGQGQVVVLSGEPGVGKSRLLTEWHREIAACDVRVLYGQCQSYGCAMPYGPLGDLLRGAWGLSESDSTEARIAKVRAGLHSAGCEAESSASYMLHLLGLEDESETLIHMAPDMLRARTFEVLQHFLLRTGRERPCLLVLEDLHWIDATSEAFLAAFVERLAGVPMLLLTTCRLGYRPAWLDKSYTTHIALQPLDVAQSRQMAQSLLPRMLSEAFVEQHILAKAQGNPLFVEELAQAAAEHDGASSTFTVPDTIQAVLAARIDRLAVEAKRLLHTAAVVGPDVPFDLLRAVTDYAPETLRRLLANLQGAELLYETQLFPESVYTFKHALTHEVAYGSLLGSHRQTLHRRIFDALERSSSDSVAHQPDRLAYHAREAVLWDKAWQYFRHAGVKALAQAANHEAVTCCEQALQCLEHLPQGRALQEVAIDIRLEMRNALLPLGDNARCLALLREAEPLAEDLDDAVRLGWISSFMSTHSLFTGDSDRAIAAGERALALAMTCDDLALRLDTHLHLGQAYHARGNYQQAVEVLQWNVKALQETTGQGGGPAGLFSLHSVPWLVWCLAEIGAFVEGRAYAEQGIRLAEAVNHPYGFVAAYSSTGLLHLRQGNLDNASSLLERALSLCRTAKIALMLPTVAASLGATYALAGRLTESLSLLEEAVVQAIAMGIMVYHAFTMAALSEAHLLAGHVEEAYTHARHALELSQTHKEDGARAWTFRLLGEIARRRKPGSVDDAAGYFQQAMALADALGMRPLAAHCHLGLGLLQCHHGEKAHAQSALSTAVALYRAMEMPLWLPQAETALAQLV